MDREQMHALMENHKQTLVEQEILKLRSLHAPHYRTIDLNLLQIRAIQLVEAFLNSFSAGAASFVTYIHGVAQERFSEGYFLEEIQGALNILGDLCDRLGEPEKAARMRQRILAFMPGHAPSCESLMRYHLDRGEEEKAREYAARLLGMGIDLPEEIRARLGLE